MRLGVATMIAIAAVAATLGLAGALGSPAAGPAWRAVSSERYGFSMRMPPGWRRSRRRLVPDLLDPREILSVANFHMRVGGGGNCGREPSASIGAMRRGDALVSIQEVAVSRRLRPHLRHNFPARPRRFAIGDLRTGAFLGDSKAAGPTRYWTFAFSDSGRAFEALVYVDGPPTPALRAEIRGVLDGLAFEPGSWRRFHGDEAGATAAG